MPVISNSEELKQAVENSTPIEAITRTANHAKWKDRLLAKLMNLIRKKYRARRLAQSTWDPRDRARYKHQAFEVEDALKQRYNQAWNSMAKAG